MAIISAGPSSAAQLEAAWSSPDPRVRRLAVDASGYLGLADGKDQLERALVDRDGPLRVRAAVALGRIGSPGSLPALRAARERSLPGSAERRAADLAIQRITGEVEAA